MYIRVVTVSLSVCNFFNLIVKLIWIIFVILFAFCILASGMSSSNVGSQTRWDNQLGVFRTSPGDNSAQSRTAQTAALIHFSRIIG